MNELTRISLALVVLCAAPVAMAADAGTFYLGGSVGQAVAQYDSSQCTGDASTDAGFLISCQTTMGSTGFKLIGGYNISPGFALEGSYANLGKLKEAANYFGYYLGTTEQTTTALSLDAVGTIAAGQGFSVSGKLGVYDAGQTASDDAGDTNSTVSSGGLNVGLRGNYALTPHLQARLEYERYVGVGKSNFHDYDSGAITVKTSIDLAALGLVYNF